MMLSHYIKIAFRAIGKDIFFSAINIAGLAIGISAVAMIFVFVANQLNYDNWLPNAKTLYRVETLEITPGRDPVDIARAPGPVRAALMKDFPQIADITRGYLSEASIEREGQPSTQTVLAADKNFFSLLGIRMVKGDARTALRGTSSIALSERRARELFGRQEAIGQRVTLRFPEARDFVVSAVFQDLPEASHMAFDVVVPLQGYFRESDAETRLIPDEWGGAYFHTYARLRDGADIDDVSRGIDAFIDRNLPQAIARLLSTAPHEFYQFRFIPIRNVHFDGGTVAAMKPGGSRATVLALSAVGILILIIASVNFANLTSARSLLRGREVALRKVVGASRQDVIYQFLVEAIVITLLASVIAIILTVLVLPQVGALLGSSDTLRLTGSWTTLPLLVVVVLATALASGIYPALIVSRVRPGAILDREANLKTTGRLRSILVTLQFSVSIALIVITIGMLGQTRYANQVDLGFDRSNAMVLRISDGPRRDEVAASMKTAVGQRPEVLGAALSSAVPSDSSEHNLSVSRPESPKPVQLGYHMVDSDFFRVYGVKPLSGRTSAMTQVVQSASQAGDDIPGSGAAVINAAALRPLNLGSAEQAVGQVLQSGDNSYTIVGVVPDLHFRSLHQRVRDEIYLLNDKAGGALTIRYKPGAGKRIASLIESDWAERSPDRAIERVFLDDALDALYVQDTRQAYLLSLFALIAVALSCLGLVAMTSYSIQRRTKEIAIRKVLGARVSDIVRLLLWQSTRPVFAANLIAWPVAWLILRRWLNGFAYRIEMPYWAFAGATVIALLIAVAAIGWHTLRVSRLRPIVALRHD